MNRIIDHVNSHYRLSVGKRNYILTLLGTMVVLGICLSGCGSGNQTVKVDVSWAQYYTSLKDLKHNSDIAISGNVTNIGASVKPVDGDGSLVYSGVTVTVTKVLWNAHSQKTVPTTILFHENGGTYQGTTYVVNDDPLYQVGQHVVLFFTEYSPGNYRVAGGPTGRFLVANGVVKSIASEGVQLAPYTNENQFVQALNAAN